MHHGARDFLRSTLGMRGSVIATTGLPLSPFDQSPPETPGSLVARR
jgi:hypothetical protein